MRTRIQLGEIDVEVIRKAIKNVHLSVHPPTGRVRIAAPERMNLNTVRVFAIAKLPWIKKQQRKLREQERETPREYVDRESHYVWGKRYLLKVVEADQPASVELNHGHLVLHVRSATDCRTAVTLLGDFAIRRRISVIADSSLASRAVSDSWLAADVLRGRVVSALLRPLSVAALRRCVLACLLLALERRRIAFPQGLGPRQTASIITAGICARRNGVQGSVCTAAILSPLAAMVMSALCQ